MAMVRKQVYIEKTQDEKLKRLAGQLGVTEAEIIRRAIEGLGMVEDTLAIREIATAKYSALDEGSLSRQRSMGSRYLDDKAWEEELAFILSLAESKPDGGSTVKWRREDAYGDQRFRLLD